MPVRVDEDKNRLYIQFKGYLDEDQFCQVLAEAVGKASFLKPGFDVITDISECKPVVPSATKQIAGMLAKMKHSGVNRIVRVHGADSLVMQQFEENSKETGIHFSYAHSVDEAEQLLEKDLI